MTRPGMPSRTRLAAIVAGFKDRRVVVVGDLVADEFVYADIARVSREAPVLILDHRETIAVPGGAGNAVANLRALGASPVPVGVIGMDPSGRRLLDRFRALGVRTGAVRTASAYETPTKSRVLAGGVHTRRQQIVRIDRGAVHGALPAEALLALRRRLRHALTGAEGLLVADYGYGASPPAILRGLGLRRRFPVTVDSRNRVERFGGVWACTPNQEELERSLGLSPIRSPRALRGAGSELLRRTGARAVLVTRGARGMCLFEKGCEPVPIPAFGTGEVADVTGAGDTVIAVFTLALLAGGTFLEASLLSNVAAGLVVMKAGTATVTRREIVDGIAEGFPP